MWVLPRLKQNINNFISSESSTREVSSPTVWAKTNQSGLRLFEESLAWTDGLFLLLVLHDNLIRQQNKHYIRSQRLEQRRFKYLFEKKNFFLKNRIVWISLIFPKQTAEYSESFHHFLMKIRRPFNFDMNWLFSLIFIKKWVTRINIYLQKTIYIEKKDYLIKTFLCPINRCSLYFEYFCCIWPLLQYTYILIDMFVFQRTGQKR
jgi:hypothetical protein